MHRTSLLLSLGLGCGTPPPVAPPATSSSVPPTHDPLGTWSGDIQTPAGGLPFVLHILPTTDGSGGLTGTADSPQQGAFGIPLSAVLAEGDTLTVESDAIRGRFAGHYTDADTLAGHWEQGGQQMPLTLARGGAVSAPIRPQTPTPPFPYREEHLTLAVPGEAHTLGATLTLPPGDGPHPGVVLITGSGPQDRDETILGHRPFWVLADHLTRQGIAVLRYDDRGVAESTGDFGTATSADLAVDAAAALAALRARPEVGAVGFIGHSEGGMLAPMAAATARPDFLVLLAPPAVPILDLMVAQHAAVARSAGFSEADLAVASPLQRQILTIAMQGDSPEARAAATALVRQQPGAAGLDDAVLAAQVAGLFSPWMVWFLRYDPAPNLAALTVPTLALWGSLDQQVLASQNEPAFQAAVAGNPQAEGVVLEGLNHLFQPAQTGAVAEYAQIETTLDPAVLERVAGWIRASVPEQRDEGDQE